MRSTTPTEVTRVRRRGCLRCITGCASPLESLEPPPTNGLCNSGSCRPRLRP